MDGFIVLEQVTKAYEATDGAALTVLDSLDWSVGKGETVAVTGPSGSGKSTLLNLIGALDRPTSGAITVGGERLEKLGPEGLTQYRAQRVGFVFQDHHLLPQLTAVENVLLPTLASPDAGRQAACPTDRATDLLARVGLGERLQSFPAQLSGGERQRVAIARALMNHPALLLCDEPTGNLDQATGEQVVTVLMQLAESEGLTVVMVTHNLHHAAACRHRYELREGKLQRSDLSRPPEGSA
jgi:ABC-type lipoprotein export system ATPase subunit